VAREPLKLIESRADRASAARPAFRSAGHAAVLASTAFASLRKFRYLVIMCRPGARMSLACLQLLLMVEREKNFIKAAVRREH
jgi:hypothetical protein